MLGRLGFRGYRGAFWDEGVFDLKNCGVLSGKRPLTVHGWLKLLHYAETYRIELRSFEGSNKTRTLALDVMLSYLPSILEN